MDRIHYSDMLHVEDLDQVVGRDRAYQTDAGEPIDNCRTFQIHSLEFVNPNVVPIHRMSGYCGKFIRFGRGELTALVRVRLLEPVTSIKDAVEEEESSRFFQIHDD